MIRSTEFCDIKIFFAMRRELLTRLCCVCRQCLYLDSCCATVVIMVLLLGVFNLIAIQQSITIHRTVKVTKAVKSKQSSLMHSLASEEVLDNKYLATHAPCDTFNTTPHCQPLKPCVYEDEVDLRVIVLTFNRAHSLNQTLQSVSQLEPDGSSIAVEIWIDCDKHGFLHKQTYHVAQAFSRKHNLARVHVWTDHVGLYGQWIDTWSPRSITTTERALFVEDDVDLSPFAWRWIKAANQRFRNMSKLAGFSLKDEHLSKRARALIREDSVFMRRHHLPWGFTPVPAVWQGFQTWFHRKHEDRKFHPYIPEDRRHTKWYKSFESLYADRGEVEQSMWTQWFHYYVHKQKLLCVFPNARSLNKKHQGLEFNRQEPGLHFRDKNRTNVNGVRLIGKWDKKYVNFPEEVKILNYVDKLYGVTKGVT